MRLDIDVSSVRVIKCPHCGGDVGQTAVETESSSGRLWHDFLQDVGYDDTMYDTEMVLSEAQM